MTQNYIGTKQVLAWDQEKDGKPGYAVKYADGYTSWSPKGIFETSYIPMGNIGHLPPFAQRMIGEHAQLLDKVTKLRGFVDSSAFMVLTGTERDHLTEQLAAMEAYLAVLDKRIAAFPALTSA